MTDTQGYTPEDIEQFLQVNKIEEEKEDKQTFAKLLRVQSKISIIANIDPQDLKAIIYNLKFIKFNYKDYIIEDGDISQEIFFILSGQCQVFHKGKKIGTLETGKTFGESAAIFSTKRSASVVCSSQNTTLLSFSINHDNMEFCSVALATLYKNLALQIDTKLRAMNESKVK
ncbi:cyclic nucleotide-binding domain-containing protein [Sulfurimonas sp.]|uniref:cyclic nucleotide-binding domain-containing protein n=1 Tax=Sulfurimonas sp. TaxID=2022749 RepID=UPI002AB09F52|nr:cyclic nucleotide-binding domain-containing protein [Sulfurimonas sp.]